MKLLDVAKNAALLSATILMCSLANLSWQAARQVQHVDLGATVAKLNVTLDKLNRPCKGAGDDKADSCGTISLAGQTMVNAGDLIKMSQVTEQREFALFNSSLPPLVSNANAAVASLSATATSLNGTAVALTGTAQAATRTLDSTTSTVAGIQPLLTNATALVGNVDGEIKPVLASTNLFLANANAVASNSNVPLILSNFASITTTGNHMLFTADQVESRLAECTLHPHFTCYLKSDLLFGAQVGGYLLPH